MTSRYIYLLNQLSFDDFATMVIVHRIGHCSEACGWEWETGGGDSTEWWKNNGDRNYVYSTPVQPQENLNSFNTLQPPASGESSRSRNPICDVLM